MYDIINKKISNVLFERPLLKQCLRKSKSTENISTPTHHFRECPWNSRVLAQQLFTQDLFFFTHKKPGEPYAIETTVFTCHSMETIHFPHSLPSQLKAKTSLSCPLSSADRTRREVFVSVLNLSSTSFHGGVYYSACIIHPLQYAFFQSFIFVCRMLFPVNLAHNTSYHNNTHYNSITIRQNF